MSEDQLEFSKKMTEFLSFFSITLEQLTKISKVADTYEGVVNAINGNFELIKTDITNMSKELSDLKQSKPKSSRPITVLEDLNAGAEEINNG